jgi:hypothetical protein
LIATTHLDMGEYITRAVVFMNRSATAWEVSYSSCGPDDWRLAGSKKGASFIIPDPLLIG